MLSNLRSLVRPLGQTVRRSPARRGTETTMVSVKIGNIRAVTHTEIVEVDSEVDDPLFHSLVGSRSSDFRGFSYFRGFSGRRQTPLALRASQA